MGNPKTDRKINDFRIFCKLIAKTMLESIDFTDVLEGYRRNEKPEIRGIATNFSLLIPYFEQCRNEKPEILGIATVPRTVDKWILRGVEMKSPRYWALQLLIEAGKSVLNAVEMKSPRYWALQHYFAFGYDAFKR